METQGLALADEERRKHGGGGCKVYRGASPFTEYGPKINPHAELFSYSKGYHWLRRAPLRPEWKAVYEHSANEARADGSCRAGVLSIGKATCLSKNGVKSALNGLTEYKLISVAAGKAGARPRTISFYKHDSKDWMPDDGSRRDPSMGHGEANKGSRRDPHKEEKKEMYFSAHAASRSETASARGEEKIFEEDEEEPLQMLSY